MVPGLQLRQRTTVEQQTIGHVSDELQGHVALKAKHHRRKPGIAVAVETVLVLLALWALKLRWALASLVGRRKRKKKKEFMNTVFFCCSSSVCKSENPCFDFKVCLPHPIALFCSFNYPPTPTSPTYWLLPLLRHPCPVAASLRLFHSCRCSH